MQRPAYLAGTWYPKNREACVAAIERHARDTQAVQVEGCGLIGPHAGWNYSGDAQGRGYRWLAEAVSSPDIVVVFGSHRSAAGPNTIFTADAWDTPLGEIIVAKDLALTVQKKLSLEEEPITTHFPDNGVELHLPFIRYFFPNAKLLMLGVAAAKIALNIGETVGKLCQAYSTVFIGSTDLTHYGPNYQFSPHGHGEQAVEWVRNTNDRDFIDAALKFNAMQMLEHGIQHQSACCPGAAAATLSAVQSYRGKSTPQLIDHYLSYDVHPAPSFVGYASIAL